MREKIKSVFVTGFLFYKGVNCLASKKEKFLEFFAESNDALKAAQKAGYKNASLMAKRFLGEMKQNMANDSSSEVAVNSQSKGSLSDDMCAVEDNKLRSRVADEEEILAVITSVLRDENASNSERLKASELLAKHYGVFSSKGDSGDEESIVDVLKKARERVKNAE